MAPKMEAHTVHPPNGVEKGSVLAIKGLIDSVQALSSQDDYKLVGSYLNEIERLQRELKDKEQGLAAQEHLTTDVAKERLSLKERLNKRDETIARLSKEKENLEELYHKLEEYSNDQKGVIEKAKGKVKEQNGELKAKDKEIRELGEKYKQADNWALRLENDLTSLKAENNSLTERHNAAADRLKELEGFPVALHEEDPGAVVDGMKHLWNNAKELVTSYFKEDLSENSLQNCGAWDKLMRSESLPHHVPLPRTNSIPAKQMRIAVILAILARSLDIHIFHPTYAFGEDSEVREVLCHLAVRESKKESFCRGLLLSLFPDEQESAANERIDSVTEHVMRHVHGLLLNPEGEEFEAGLSRLARSAYETWATIRAIKERYEPSFDGAPVEGFEWDTLLFDGDIVGSTDEKTAIHGGRDDAILIVLPRLYVIEKNQPPQLIADGTVLRRSQSLAAAQELEEEQMAPQANLTFGQTSSNRPKPRRRRNASGSWNGSRSSENQRFLE